MFTKEELRNSQEFKDWIKGTVSLIHNIYPDTGDIGASYIVLHIDTVEDKIAEHLEQDTWTITRFFKGGSKIQVSVDHSKLSAKKVFGVLLSQYSRGLE